MTSPFKVFNCSPFTAPTKYTKLSTKYKQNMNDKGGKNQVSERKKSTQESSSSESNGQINYIMLLLFIATFLELG